MPKKKVAIALSEWLLDELDSEAESAGRSRSSLVEEAVTQYVIRHQADKRDDAFRERAGRAIDDAEAIAAEYSADPKNASEPSSLEILRAIRREEP